MCIYIYIYTEREREGEREREIPFVSPQRRLSGPASGAVANRSTEVRATCNQQAM